MPIEPHVAWQLSHALRVARERLVRSDLGRHKQLVVLSSLPKSKMNRARCICHWFTNSVLNGNQFRA